MKTVACRDMGIDCDWKATGETMDELVKKSKEHTKMNHREYWDKTMSKMSDEEIKKDIEPYVKEV